MNRNNDQNDEDRADRSVGLTQPSLTTPERRRRHDPGDAERLPTRRTSRLRSHDSDNDDATQTPSIITESGERSLLMPARRTEATLSEGNVGAGERDSRPSLKDKKARARLELALAREPDDADLPRRRTVSGSAPPPPPREATAHDDERGSRPFSEDKGNSELVPAREQGPEDLMGRRVVDASVVVEEQHDVVRGHHHAVESGSSGIEVQPNLRRLGPTPLVDDDQQEFELEDGGAVQPGAFRVGGNRVRDDATAEGTIWGGVDSAEETGMAEDNPDDPEDDLFSAQLVDPEAERLRLESEVERMVHERLAEQGLETADKDTFCEGVVVCGVDFSKRTNQVICLLVLAFAVASLLATLFATNVVGPQSSTSAAAASPSLGTPTPFPGPLPVTPAPIFAPELDAQWVQVGNDIDGENPGDQSGSSVALSSNGAVLAIGANNSDDGAGHVRVYINTGGRWEQRGSDLDGSATGDMFGSSVSLSADGTILAVGAPNADGVNGVDSGRVYGFQWISNAWQPLGSTLNGAGSDDVFGYSLALSDDGTILAVGAFGNNAGGFGAGHVQVFAWTDTDWNQRGSDLLGLFPGDIFGYSVALSSDGSIVAGGAGQDGNSGSGYVRIHRWSGSAWQQEGSTLMGFSANDYFGFSVSLSGDGSTIAVGAYETNYAVVYRNDGTDWVQIGQTFRAESSRDKLGLSLSLSFDGKTIVFGVPFVRNLANVENGYALVFRLSPNGQEWMQVGQQLFGEAAYDRFGWSTSISDSGTRIAIGAISNDGNGVGADTGHVRVYDLQ